MGSCAFRAGRRSSFIGRQTRLVIRSIVALIGHVLLIASTRGKLLLWESLSGSPRCGTLAG